jgi:hypothetical protein
MARQTSGTIIERKTRLDGTVSEYRCERLSLEVDRRAVLRYTMDREWVIADTGIVLRPGQITIAHYWNDRPYNVYHWLDGLKTIAYYCNVASDTTIRDDVVGYTDLVIDVLLRPSGRPSCSMRRSSRPTSRRRGGSISRARWSRSPPVRAVWSRKSIAKHAPRWAPNHAGGGWVFPQVGVAGLV